MNRFLGKNAVLLSFYLALALLGGADILSYKRLLNSTTNRQWVDHTHEVLTALDKISDGIKDAAVARHDYKITGNDVYLDTVQTGIEATEQALKDIRYLTRDNSDRQLDIAKLEPLVQQRIELLKLLPRESKVEIVNTEIGRDLDLKIDNRLALIGDRESYLLQLRSKATSDSIYLAFTAILFSDVIGFGLLIGVYLVLRQQIAERRKAQTELQVINEELEARILERTAALTASNQQLQQEISDRLQAEHNLDILNRALMVLSAGNEALGKANDEMDLLQKICRIVIELGGYRFAWIGYVQHDSNKSVKPITYAGYEAGYLDSANITWDDTEHGRGPSGTAIRSGKPCIAQDMLTTPNFAPWREAALQRGYQSSLVLPLKEREQVFGIFNIYATEPDTFNEDEVRLLVELADNLSYGIIALRNAIERNRIEADLRQSQAQLQAILDHSVSTIYVKDKLGKYLIANRQFEELFHLSPAEIVGKTDLELFEPAMAHTYQANDRLVLTTQRPLQVEEYVVLGDGIRTYISVKFPIYNAAGELYGLGGISTDITERKQAEEILRQTRDQLEQKVQVRTFALTEANKFLQMEIAERLEAERQLEELAAELKRSNQELEQFAYVASHDLQEPLRAIAGYTQLLQNYYQDRLDETSSKYMTYVIDGSKRMSQLIQDLLAYSRVGNRNKPFTSVDCNLVLQQVLEDLSIAIAESNARITYTTLPTVQGDKLELLQLLQNLIGNAIKFCRDRTPIIHISAELQDQEWVFKVCDNGIGIKPQYLERIFVIFKRLHTRTEFPGTGIGLAICKKIVSNHGGRIWVESELNTGTTFFFTVPHEL